MADRGRDAADIFTLTIGTGAGGKLRVGPIQLAAVENADLVGLRSGQFTFDGNGLVLNDETYMPIPVHSFRIPTLHAPTWQHFRVPQKKSSTGKERLERSWMTSRSKWTRLFGEESFSHGVNSTSARRNKNVLAKSPAPLVAVGATAPYYTQVEVVAGFAFTVRAGINLGEALDFILGWTGVDIYRDDLP